ncbi:MAG: CDP-glucose 4,6-dehydratase [Candidatus Methanomethyliaceae archaeon]
MKENFWVGKKVLLTGHSGFKGGWLALWLSEIGAKLIGVALPPETRPNLFEEAGIEKLLSASYWIDMSLGGRVGELRKIIERHEPEVVFHLAAQAIVRRGYREPVSTWASNLMGTVHLLEAIRSTLSVRVAVFVTTDKVYYNRNWCYPYRENDEVGGTDPYSASKAACELAISSYRFSFFQQPLTIESSCAANRPLTIISSARAGNVIGGGDWAEDRLIPDAVKAWSRGGCLLVRNPDAVRPWQHVLEPLSGYILLAEKLWDNPGLAGAYNFGPPAENAVPVSNVVEEASRLWGEGARYEFVDVENDPPEAHYLTLETSKARKVLGYASQWSFPEALERTIKWYRAFYSGEKARKLCENDIAAFQESVR